MRAGAALCSTAQPTAAAWVRICSHIDFVGVALEELAAGGVAEDVDVGVRERAEDAGGLVGFGEVELAVDAGYDDV